jgi:hypothetical protein
LKVVLPGELWCPATRNTTKIDRSPIQRSTFIRGEFYQNYADASLPDYRAAYWGSAYPKLLSIKQKYDPTNFFNYQQSIR